jgi:hypothetical protein
MTRSRSRITGFTPKLLASCFLILAASVGLYSAGDVFYLEADPLAVTALAGHETTVRLDRPEASLAEDVVVRLESLDPDVATVPDSIVIPAGTRGIDIPIMASRAGAANITARAQRFGAVLFSVNVFDPLDRADLTVLPERIDLVLGRGEAATRRVSITTDSTALPRDVDIAFTVDARDSFVSAASRLADAASAIDDRLKKAFPNVVFAYSVSKFHDYGGPGKIFKRLDTFNADSELTRPFVLLMANTFASATGVTASLKDALGTTLPGARDTGTMASFVEALQQIAQGNGLDADDNGSKLDSGVAAVKGDTSTKGYLFPGTSGDVPPFSSRPGSITTAGTQGGVGFRAGSLRIVVLATNTYTVAPYDRAKPLPDTITGVGNSSVGTFVFSEVNAYSAQGTSPGTFQNPRFGPVSASATVADPINAVAPKGAATLLDSFKAINDQNMKVVSFYQISQPSPFGRALVDPIPMLRAIARLTASLDQSRIPLVFELLGANAAGVADQIIAAVTPPITQARTVSLRAVGNDQNFGFTYTPSGILVSPGDTAEYSVTITGTGTRGSFEIQFVTDDGIVLGRIPVNVTTADTVAPRITGITPARGPIGTAVTVTGTDFTTTLADLRVTFAGIVAPVSSATTTTINTSVPAGSVAGLVNVVVRVGALDSNPFPFTVLHTINSLVPTSGLAGIPFTITGSAFASGTTGNTVTFGTVNATITDANNTTVRGIVPPTLAPGPYLVRITTNGVTTDVGTFTVILPPPSITSIVPSRGPGDTAFTINGAGFSTTLSNNVITFTDRLLSTRTTVTPTAATSTTLSGRVPFVTAGEYTVTLSVSGVAATGSLTFTVEPLITAVTPSPAIIGSLLRITGTGFSATMADNAVTLNGRSVTLDSSSTAATLVVTVPRGTSGANLQVQVTTRGVPSNIFTVPLSQVPVAFAECVRGIFERRDRLVITVCGSDATGDVVSVALTIRDGEGQVLGDFPAIDVRSLLAGRFDFEFSVPFDQANHFTAAITVTVQLKDAAGNTSNSVTGKITNPDIRP